MNAARPFTPFHPVMSKGSKLRQAWLGFVALLLSFVVNLTGAYAAPGDVNTLNLNIVGTPIGGFVYASAVQPDGDRCQASLRF